MSETVIKESLRHLQSQGYAKEQAQEFFDKWQQQKTGIAVRIEYEDIYGNQMSVLEETLT
jgi:FMN-dependent NADH-azoreductase